VLWRFLWIDIRNSFLSVLAFAARQLMAVHTVLDLAANQTSLTVQFSLEPEHATPILDQILPFLGLAGTECEINDHVMPMKTSPQFTLCPSVESALGRWTPWDDDLSSEHRYHLLVTDVALYGRMQAHSARHQHAIVLSFSFLCTYVRLQCEAPKIAKLVYNPIVMVYGTYNYSYWCL
jgi:hypothetical protein